MNSNGANNYGGKDSWDDYDNSNTQLIKDQKKSKPKSKDLPIWNDPKDSKLPPPKQDPNAYDWGPPFGKNWPL
jgi:hypothetical protein